jgi:CspA family cold shock protein
MSGSANQNEHSPLAPGGAQNPNGPGAVTGGYVEGIEVCYRYVKRISMWRFSWYATSQPLQLERCTMPTGTVKWFSSQHGIGAIQPDDGSNDVHIAEGEGAKIGNLRDGARCSYELEQKGGTTYAVDIKLL